ncbi:MULTISPECIES: class I SAM-dependent methyltransferase [Acidiphilium]|uniref:Methyltransferase domain-containing protein n=1 Tax=Acidiphilium rubrum TaxID=526 RepID=A0A8G2CM53_ACIRU|nr:MULTISPECIES: class I SAM-dependent methyltransferase [Acidiphilium]SIR16370.1 Methyltransferase domain-containing protein [Acidiphilium rubrum]
MSETADRAIEVMPFHAGIDYFDCLSRLQDVLAPARYLEIGVWRGESLERSRAASIAIDPHFLIDRNIMEGKPSCHLFQTGSDAFFATEDPVTTLGGPIDLAFLDGMHHFEFLLRDFANTERVCHPGSAIVLHDCLPIDPRIAHRDQSEDLRVDAVVPGWWAGDVWKVPVLLKRFRPDLTMIAFDAPPTGLIVITGLDPANRSLNEHYQTMVDAMMAVDLASYGTARLFDLLAPHPTRLLDDPAALRATLFPGERR